MSLKTNVLYILLIVCCFWFVCNFNELFTIISRYDTHILPQIVDLAETLASKVQDYYALEMIKDISKFLKLISIQGGGISNILQPLCQRFVDGIVYMVNCVHSNAMFYTQDGLNQILGIEDSLGLYQVPESRYKVLSVILLVSWILSGIVLFSRMSCNKFIVFMATSFLLHSVFGPVWCMRRLAFAIGLLMWMASIITEKPILTAITVIALFFLTGLRKWRKRLAADKSAEDLAKFNLTMEQRIDGIDQKLDRLLLKVDNLNEKLTCHERHSYTRA